MTENTDAATELGEDLDSDFDSGFEQSTSTVTPTKTEQPDNKDANDEQAEKQDAPVIEYAQIPKTEYERLLASAAAIDEVKATQDKAFGKIGEVSRTLGELQTKLSAETPSGEAIEISEEDFAELRQEYPELAELQIKGLNAVLNKMRTSGAGLSEEKVSEMFNAQLGTAQDSLVQLVEQRIEMRFLERKHPDWQEMGNTDEFVTFVHGLPEADQARVYEANQKYDSAVLIETFDNFKEFRKKKANSSRNEIIEGAITPQGDGHTPGKTKSEDDEFNEGFNSK